MAKRTQEELQTAIAEYNSRHQFTYKTDIWQRVTDEEAVTLDEQLKQAPPKQRRMWDDSLSVEHSSEYYGMLKQQMESVFGVERTAIILAPSQV